MTTFYIASSKLFAAIAPLLVASLCWLLWWAELMYWVEPQGVGWTNHQWYSIYAIIVLIVGLFLWPLQRSFGMPWKWIVFYGVLLSGVSGGAYWGIRSIFQTLYVEIWIGGAASSLIAWSIWKLLGLALIVALVYFLPLWHFHKTTEGMHILTLLEVFVLVVPCSLMSLELFPMGTQQVSFIYAVKLGYPVFWLPIGLGYLSRAVAEEWI